MICIPYQQVTMSIANSTSWAPIGESSLDILNDSVHLIASTVITGMTYGVVLTLYCICAHILLPQVKTVKRRQAVFTFIYISWMFLFCTVYVASNARNTQLAYVNNRNFPGGPAQYTIFIFDQPTTKVGLVAFFAINWMTDAVLVYTLFFLFSRNLLSTARYGVSLFCTKLPVFAMRFSRFPASCSLHLLVCQHNIFLRDRNDVPPHSYEPRQYCGVLKNITVLLVKHCCQVLCCLLFLDGCVHNSHNIPHDFAHLPCKAPVYQSLG